MITILIYNFWHLRGKIPKEWHFLVFALSVEEAEFTAYIRRNGRLTVPKEVRDALGIAVGNLVKCKIKKVKT